MLKLNKIRLLVVAACLVASLMVGVYLWDNLPRDAEIIYSVTKNFTIPTPIIPSWVA